jgi:inosose dehydratase
MDRREFGQLVALGLGASALPAWAQGRKNLKIGHTGITWPGGSLPAAGRAQGGAAAAAAAPPAQGRSGDPGLAPPPTAIRPVDANAIEQIFKDVSSLGFQGLELFGWQIEGMEANGGIGKFVEQYRLPLISSYGGPNLTDPAQRKPSIERLVATATVVKKHGGKVIVFGPNGVNRAGFVFADHKSDIIAALNEGAKAVTDLGLTAVLHQHTGTCIETRDETYAVMEAVDTRYLKFGPDIGQLQKGGSDPVQVVKDFLPLIHHMHLKDYVGGEAFVGYCPLGQGKVDLATVLKMMDGRAIDGMLMVELDGTPNMPMTPLETATIAKAYLAKQGVTFRA